jgi:hypothetical protein
MTSEGRGMREVERFRGHRLLDAPTPPWEALGLVRNDLPGQPVGPAPVPALFVRDVDLRGKPSELVVTADISADLVARAIRRAGEGFELDSVCAIPLGGGRVRCVLRWEAVLNE